MRANKPHLATTAIAATSHRRGRKRKHSKARPAKHHRARNALPRGPRINKPHVAVAVISAPAASHQHVPLPSATSHYAAPSMAMSSTPPDTGQLAECAELLSKCSDDGAPWIVSGKDEFGRLCQGHGTDMVPINSTETIRKEANL
jgi:hypothetical protein